MSKRISIGNYHAGPFCGVRVFRPSTWLKYYPLFKKSKGYWGFSIGPILFWKGKI